MLTSKTKCRIVGIHLGEAHINMIRDGVPPLAASFALVREDEERAGLVERRFEWSQKTMSALEALQAAMEEDMMDHLFEPQPPAASEAEPEQM